MHTLGEPGIHTSRGESQGMGVHHSQKQDIEPPSRRCSLDEKIAALEDPSVDHHISALELSSLIKKAYNTLPVTAGDTFRLSRVDGLTNREISEKKGLSVKAVEYHIKISLRHFRDKLKEYIG